MADNASKPNASQIPIDRRTALGLIGLGVLSPALVQAQPDDPNGPLNLGNVLDTNPETGLDRAINMRLHLSSLSDDPAKLSEALYYYGIGMALLTAYQAEAAEAPERRKEILEAKQEKMEGIIKRLGNFGPILYPPNPQPENLIDDDRREQVRRETTKVLSEVFDEVSKAPNTRYTLGDVAEDFAKIMLVIASGTATAVRALTASHPLGWLILGGTAVVVGIKSMEVGPRDPTFKEGMQDLSKVFADRLANFNTEYVTVSGTRGPDVNPVDLALADLDTVIHNPLGAFETSAPHLSPDTGKPTPEDLKGLELPSEAQKALEDILKQGASQEQALKAIKDILSGVEKKVTEAAKDIKEIKETIKKMEAAGENADNKRAELEKRQYNIQQARGAMQITSFLLGQIFKDPAIQQGFNILSGAALQIYALGGAAAPPLAVAGVFLGAVSGIMNLIGNRKKKSFQKVLMEAIKQLSEQMHRYYVDIKKDLGTIMNQNVVIFENVVRILRRMESQDVWTRAAIKSILTQLDALMVNLDQAEKDRYDTQLAEALKLSEGLIRTDRSRHQDTAFLLEVNRVAARIHRHADLASRQAYSGAVDRQLEPSMVADNIRNRRSAAEIVGLMPQISSIIGTPVPSAPIPNWQEYSNAIVSLLTMRLNLLSGDQSGSQRRDLERDLRFFTRRIRAIQQAVIESINRPMFETARMEAMDAAGRYVNNLVGQMQRIIPDKDPKIDKTPNAKKALDYGGSYFTHDGKAAKISGPDALKLAEELGIISFSREPYNRVETVSYHAPPHRHRRRDEIPNDPIPIPRTEHVQSIAVKIIFNDNLVEGFGGATDGTIGTTNIKSFRSVKTAHGPQVPDGKGATVQGTRTVLKAPLYVHPGEENKYTLKSSTNEIACNLDVVRADGEGQAEYNNLKKVGDRNPIKRVYDIVADAIDRYFEQRREEALSEMSRDGKGGLYGDSATPFNDASEMMSACIAMLHARGGHDLEGAAWPVFLQTPHMITTLRDKLALSRPDRVKWIDGCIDIEQKLMQEQKEQLIWAAEAPLRDIRLKIIDIDRQIAELKPMGPFAQKKITELEGTKVLYQIQLGIIGKQEDLRERFTVIPDDPLDGVLLTEPSMGDPFAELDGFSHNPFPGADRRTFGLGEDLKTIFDGRDPDIFKTLPPELQPNVGFPDILTDPKQILPGGIKVDDTGRIYVPDQFDPDRTRQEIYEKTLAYEISQKIARIERDAQKKMDELERYRGRGETNINKFAWFTFRRAVYDAADQMVPGLEDLKDLPSPQEIYNAKLMDQEIDTSNIPGLPGLDTVLNLIETTAAMSGIDISDELTARAPTNMLHADTFATIPSDRNRRYQNLLTELALDPQELKRRQILRLHQVAGSSRTLCTA